MEQGNTYHRQKIYVFLARNQGIKGRYNVRHPHKQMPANAVNPTKYFIK